MRKLYIFTKLEAINSFVDKIVLTTWYETTREISEGSGDVYTTQMYALAGAQGTFEEIYIDETIIWPNEKQTITQKELRPAHNLCRIFGSWFRYRRDGELI